MDPRDTFFHPNYDLKKNENLRCLIRWMLNFLFMLVKNNDSSSQFRGLFFFQDIFAIASAVSQRRRLDTRYLYSLCVLKNFATFSQFLCIRQQHLCEHILFFQIELSNVVS
jgi:hypothetical protein